MSSHPEGVPDPPSSGFSARNPNSQIACVLHHAIFERTKALGDLGMKNLTRITLDPAVMGGKACIRGLRVTVGTIMGLLAAGRTQEEILKAYPYLEADDFAQALAYAPRRGAGDSTF
jgi:uncharacterized protein (DUF433 family)